LNLTALSTSIPMERSASLFPYILMISPAAIDKYVQLLSQHFKCRDLGATRFLLGIAVERDRPTRTLKLHQRQFILDTLEKYSMSDSKPVQTPLPPKLPLSHLQEDKDFMSKVPYLSAVGSLQYLAMMTHPDIAPSVAYLARFNANSGPAHWNALKHLFRYIKGTSDDKLTYHGVLAGSEPFITYTDASHGDCVDTGCSTASFDHDGWRCYWLVQQVANHCCAFYH